MARAHLAIAAAFAGALAITPSAAIAYPLLDGLGGPSGFGNDSLPENDDGSSSSIDIGTAFPSGLHFFTSTWRALFLNNNGNVTFNSGLFEYTPGAFPVADQPMIAPWWADVDTRGQGLLTTAGVFWHITPGRFVATWHNVGYFASHFDHRNDFQLILTDRSADNAPGDFDVEFRYNRCEWVTGDASGGSGGFGGTPAQAGFDAGNRRDFFALPGSRTMAILDVCHTSNIATPGRWIFSIRAGEILPYDLGSERPDAGPQLLLEGRAGPCFCSIPGAVRPRFDIARSLGGLAFVAMFARRRRSVTRTAG